jgi:small multidrug resistance pump
MRKIMGYIYLFFAVIGEIIGTTNLKSTNNFTQIVPSIYVIVGYGVAFYFMMLAMKTIPVATTYSIWSGIGIAGVAVIGALKYKEIPDIPALLGMSLIILGIIVMVFYSKMGTN